MKQLTLISSLNILAGDHCEEARSFIMPRTAGLYESTHMYTILLSINSIDQQGPASSNIVDRIVDDRLDARRFNL